MGKLTTHVLDTANGKPGDGIGVRLYSLDNGRHLVASSVTDGDGRTAALLEGDAFRPGAYELEFAVGAYFRRAGAALPEPPFLDDVTIRVNLGDDEHYHVPLLVSPWGYSTYRGS